MFTGLVQAVGVVKNVSQTDDGARLTIDPAGWDHRPEPGESISVRGVCLSLAEPIDQTGGDLVFDAVPETLARSTLGALDPGHRVNLERSLRAGDPVGGHFVQGHVDGVGTVRRVQRDGDRRLTVQPPTDLLDYLAPKGSVCIDGVSLTVAGLGGAVFEVALIPTTLENTTLADLDDGDQVNIETDMIARAVVAYLQRRETPPKH